MSRQYYRALKLLDLLQSNPLCSGSFLCEKLEIQPRMLRRLASSLKDLGYPICSAQGPGGGYWLGQGASLPPILLDDAEAIAVVAGLYSGSASSIEGLQAGSLKAMRKIERMLPDRLQKQVAMLRQSTLTIAVKGPTVSHETLTKLGTACNARRYVTFSYVGHNGAASERVVEPYKMVQNGYLWYLVAWDRNRVDWRTFRVDKAGSLEILSETFAPRDPPSDDVARQTVWSVSNAGYEFRGSICIHAPLEVALPRVPAGAGILDKIDEQSCRLETGANSLTILAIYLLEMGLPFSVEGPENLRQEIRRASQALQESLK